MTITTNPARNEYTSTAGQTVFNYTFKIYTNTDLDVYVTPSGQEPDDSADITTDYVVDPGTIGDEAGGFITFNTPLNVGDSVTIVSSIPTNRTVDYQNNGDFLPDTVNDDFDRAISLIKQIENLTGRTVTFEESVQNASSLTLPAPDANKFIRWKSDESGFENVDITSGSAVLNDIANYSAYGDYYTDSGSANTYVLTSANSLTMPDAYAEGMRVRFKPANSSTGASTVKVGSLATVNITDSLSGSLISGLDVQLSYNSSSGEFEFTKEYIELLNFIKSAGITASTDVDQLSRSSSIYSSGADFYEDSGAADAYVCSTVGSKLAPPAYFEGMRVRFVPDNTNTGASTVNVDSLGVINIKETDGTTDIAAGDIVANTEVELSYRTSPSAHFVITSSGVGPSGRFLDANELYHVAHRTTSGTNGGTITQNTWQTRTLNAVISSTLVGASLSSNQVTLPAGVYVYEGYSTAIACSIHQARLQNITDGVTVEEGSTELGDTVYSGSSESKLSGTLNIATPKVFEIQHNCKTTKTSIGFGIPNNGFTTSTNTYAEILFWRVG